MLNDPIVEEMRKNGQAFTARYNNNLAAICNALKEKEQSMGRKVVNRAPVPTTESRRKLTMSQTV